MNTILCQFLCQGIGLFFLDNVKGIAGKHGFLLVVELSFYPGVDVSDAAIGADDRNTRCDQPLNDGRTQAANCAGYQCVSSARSTTHSVLQFYIHCRLK